MHSMKLHVDRCYAPVVNLELNGKHAYSSLLVSQFIFVVCVSFRSSDPVYGFIVLYKLKSSLFGVLCIRILGLSVIICC